MVLTNFLTYLIHPDIFSRFLLLLFISSSWIYFKIRIIFVWNRIFCKDQFINKDVFHTPKTKWTLYYDLNNLSNRLLLYFNQTSKTFHKDTKLHEYPSTLGRGVIDLLAIFSNTFITELRDKLLLFFHLSIHIFRQLAICPLLQLIDKR